MIVQHLGGKDGFCYGTPTTGALDSIRNIRPQQFHDPRTDNMIDLFDDFSVHSSFRLLEPYLDRTRLFLNTEIASLSPEVRSHANAQDRMALGGAKAKMGGIGWSAKLQGTVELIGLGGHPRSFNCEDCEKPLLTSSLQAIDLNLSLIHI